MDAEKEFIKYTERYRQYGDKIQLKIGHSLRVRDLCADIAKSLGLDKKETGLASVCGLLHDIGRFDQWERYGTYNDLRSADHGDLGALVLQKDGLIGAFSETDHDTIIKAVRYHNKYKVPGTLNGRNRMFADITRDADKIDIIYCIITGELTTSTANTTISDTVCQALAEKRVLRKKDLETKADEIALRLAFVFDLNFKRSLELIRENDYMNKLIDVHKKDAPDPELQKQLENLRVFINDCINERIVSLQ